MSNPFIAEVRPFAFNFAPKGWAQCNGQLILISQNTALFSLLGKTYGGDGTTNFALPNLQGNVVLGAGQGQGFSMYGLGQTGGSSTVTLLDSQMPAHNHSLMAATTPADSTSPNAFAQASIYAPPSSSLVPFNGQALSIAGGDLPHNNMQPYLTVNFCIALQGVFPLHSNTPNT